MTVITSARRIRIHGVVQGVGFRPFVFRLARAHALHGWILNFEAGVEIHLEGGEGAIEAFLQDVRGQAPPAARIHSVEVAGAPFEACQGFEIRASQSAGRPTARISPDLPVCQACLRELFDPRDRRAGYPYINCTDCGPRFSIVRALPYDRRNTTMAGWPMCDRCAREYHEPPDRRFHAQPVACPECGPHYLYVESDTAPAATALPIRDDAAIARAAAGLREGRIVAIKGIGGYHLACDADNHQAVAALRDRKYRKEQAFAVMVRDLEIARSSCELTSAAEALLESPARPIVLAPRRADLPGVAPDSTDLGLMLPYAPVHHLLFARGAPRRLVMTSGNRSSEPIAFRDEDAFGRLRGMADAFLAGERPISRRLDDSIARAGALGPVILRRSRGLAPAAVAALPRGGPILALGGDLKNAITIVIDGAACVSQHIGDLRHHEARVAFRDAAEDLLAIYEVGWSDVLVVHDQHPQYVSTLAALDLPARERLAVQHHRAHIASVVAERGALDVPVLGIAVDGMGYGDDGTIWGCEFFAGSVGAGFERVGRLRPALLAGGDAAAQFPVQAAAGFLHDLSDLPDMSAPPFGFPVRFTEARAIVRSGMRTFPATSAGRLFDAVAALIGFTRPITFEGQAAIWLEHLARGSPCDAACPMPFTGGQLDWRPALEGVIRDRLAGADPSSIARAFVRGFAHGLAGAAASLLERLRLTTVVISGGVAQNDLLLSDLRQAPALRGTAIWINHAVPANDGGLSLGQAALAAAQRSEKTRRFGHKRG